VDFEKLPMAYLVSAEQCNHDDSNYWIFSEAGLRRLLDRCGWQVVDFLTVGASDSDPENWEGDQRAYCFARSRRAEMVSTADLLTGWHAMEKDHWRWTEGRFSAIFRDEAPRAGGRLRLKFAVPDFWMTLLGNLEIGATANGVALPLRVYTAPGDHIYEEALPDGFDFSQGVRVEFAINKTFAPPPPDKRRLGIIASRLELV
jgi:hypothetical protein